MFRLLFLIPALRFLILLHEHSALLSSLSETEYFIQISVLLSETEFRRSSIYTSTPPTESGEGSFEDSQETWNGRDRGGKEGNAPPSRNMHAEAETAKTSKKLHIPQTLAHGTVSTRLKQHDCWVRFFASPIPNLIRWGRRVYAKYSESNREWVPVKAYSRFEPSTWYTSTRMLLLSEGGNGIAKLTGDTEDQSDKHQIFIVIDDMEAHYRRAGKGSHAANAVVREAGHALVDKRSVEQLSPRGRRSEDDKWHRQPPAEGEASRRTHDKPGFGLQTLSLVRPDSLHICSIRLLDLGYPPRLQSWRMKNFLNNKFDFSCRPFCGAHPWYVEDLDKLRVETLGSIPLSSRDKY
ncbi:hypothetical protein BS47DRAFT_1488962 [Hydnum rufescens UP504]|uniref:Uncharacterized protein n=1 Tax=Hydnum rufescens UP504 TaxID=1448309 RepID=A0A9P6AJY7_9AGAM|nr:hypothetical protein BS47DRAFT_1488962 [Hydnum rufescens UP504]